MLLIICARASVVLAPGARSLSLISITPYVPGAGTAAAVLLVVLLLQAGDISLCLGGDHLGEKGRLEVLAEDEGIWRRRKINQPRVHKISIWFGLTLFKPYG